MGSWSVYCGLSQIAITAGQKCVFLPLIKRPLGSNNYDPYIPAMLPIFGEYNDYGGIEDIERNENIDIIEKYYGCRIEELCDFLTDGRRDYNSENSDWSGKEHLKPLENMKYMWIDRKVWNFMSTFHPTGYGRSGDFDLGKPDFLTSIGFKLIDKTTDPRYTNHYRYDDGKVVIDLKSDGTWVNTFNGDLIYNLGHLKKMGVDVSKFEKGEEHNYYSTFDYSTRVEKLGWVIGVDRYLTTKIDMEELLMSLDPETRSKLEISRKERNAKRSEQMIEMFGKDAAVLYTDEDSKVNLRDVYGRLIKDNDFVCGSLADMVTVKLNMHPGSMTWAPFILYLTPQCGEYRQHQTILETFAKINKEIITENGYEDENDDDDN